MDQIRSVPFLDLSSQIDPIRDELLEVIHTSINNTDFVLGPALKTFEEAFARYLGVKHVIGVNSGTDALLLCLRALDIGPGDEVITVPNMFVAAVEAIVLTGARPVIVDVEPDTYLIDTAAVEAVVNDRTKAVIPVHLFGAPADMSRLMALAQQHGFHVIEDACQSHGATYGGRKTGGLGHVGAFSFYPTKNLGAFGDGGAVTTNDDSIAEQIRLLRHHSQTEKNTHISIGYNSRLDSIQAAVLNTKLPYLDAWNTRRVRMATRVQEALAGTEFGFQRIYDDATSVYHVLAVTHPRAAEVRDQLDQAKIGWGNHIARPIHLQPGYRYLGYEAGAVPVSEKLCDELVSLPVCPSLTDAHVDYMTDVLAKVGVSV